MNINMKYNETKTIECMNGIFYDADLDPTLNHLSATGHYLSISAGEVATGFLMSLNPSPARVTSNTTPVTASIQVNSANYNSIGTGKNIVVNVTATDEDGASASETVNIAISNNAPVVKWRQKPTATLELGNTVPVEFTVQDENLNDILTTHATRISLDFVERGSKNMPFTLTNLIISKPSSTVLSYRFNMTVISASVSGVLFATVQDECGAETIISTQINVGATVPTIAIEDSIVIAGRTYDVCEGAIVEDVRDPNGDYANTDRYLPFIVVPADGDDGTHELKVEFSDEYEDGNSAVQLDNVRIMYGVTGEASARITASEYFPLTGNTGMIIFKATQDWNGDFDVFLYVKNTSNSVASDSLSVLVNPANSKPIKL